MAGGTAVFICDEEVFELERTGFWKSNVQISQGGSVVLKTYPEKWYANTSIVEFKEKKYRLVIRNNPLAEFAITDNGADVLVYSLTTQNNELQVKITSAGTVHPIFDFLLWYLFLPVATENFGDNYFFQFAMPT